MSPTVSTRLVLVLLCVVALTGAVDAAVERAWDFLAVFGLNLALAGLLLLRHQSRRPAVPLRADLVDWLREQASRTGEDPEIVADRALGAYRAGLVPFEPTGPPPGAAPSPAAASPSPAPPSSEPGRG